MAVEVKSQVNFLKGLNLATGKTTVIPGTVVRTSNLHYVKRGSLVTIDGTSMWAGGPVSPLTFGVSSNEVIYLGTIPYGPAGLLPVALTTNDVLVPGQRYGPFLYDISTNPADNGIQIQAPWNPMVFGELSPQIINVNNFAVFLFGNNIAPSYRDFYNKVPPIDGISNLVGLGTVLGAAHGVFHGGQLWLWNTFPFPFQDDGPSVLRASAFLADGSPDLTSFPPLYRAIIDANDGQQGMGCISFTSSEFGIAPTPTLVLFKNFSTFQVTGRFGDASITITRAQTDMGCVAPRTIQFVPGFGIVRLTHFGVAVFDGVKDTLISEEIRPYFFQQESDIVPINWASVTRCVACVTVNPPMYVLAVPVQGSSHSGLPFPDLDRLFCYDLVLKAWTVVDIPQDLMNFSGIGYIATLKIPNMVPITLLGDAPIAGPQQFTATGLATGGAITSGLYYLMVTAIVNGQETAPSQEQVVFVPVGAGSIVVSISALIPDATSYRVYLGINGHGTEDRFHQTDGAGPTVITSVGFTDLVAGTPPRTLGIRRWLNGDQTWDTIRQIDWRTRLPEVFGKSPSSRVFYRRSVLRARASTAKVTGLFTASGVQQSVTVQKSFAPLSPGALYGSGHYGSSRYGDAYPDLVLPFDVGLVGTSANAEFSGKGPIEMMANDWHFVPRPEGAPTRIS